MSTFEHTDWDEYARCYDSLLGLKPYTDMLCEVVEIVSSHPYHAILDASCGTGNFEHMLCKNDTNTFHVTGVDTADAMLERARMKCAPFPHCSFVTADLNQTLHFGDESFAQVVSLNTLYAVECPEETLREFWRVLERGGNVHVVTPRLGYDNGLILKEHCESALPDAYWADIHRSPEREEQLVRAALGDEAFISDMLTVARFNRSIAREQAFHFYQPDELLELLERVGFNVQHTSFTYANQDIFITAQKGD